LAETARDALSLDRVLFIPARQPPHKSARGLLPGAVRYELVQLAIRDHPAFVASDIELQRDNVSYSFETVQILSRQLPTAKLFLLIGQDMLSVRWKGWEELRALCTVVVAHRPGVATPRREAELKWLPMPQVEIASSDIRARLKAGRSIRYLVPTAVERYIRQHQLYGGKNT
jgi:nicotinate-nucleotide adenylyltransferase